MAAATLAFIILGIVVLVVAVPAGIAWLSDENRKKLGERTTALHIANAKLKIAEKTLKGISSDVLGNPALEAQLALDEIYALETKELK